MKCEVCRGSGCEQVAMGHGNIDVVDCSLCFGSGSYPAFRVARSFDGMTVDVDIARDELLAYISWVPTIGMDGVE